MDGALLTLPWQIQFSLAAGYGAYALAYMGIRSHHQTVDVAFRTLVFSAIATFALYQTSPILGEAWATLVAAFVALATGLLWRSWGRGGVRRLLASLRLAFADDEPSAFSGVFGDTRHHVSQITVILDDGKELHCRDTSAFADAPISPFILGLDGSIAMYATHESSRDASGAETETEYETVRDRDWGDRMTLIPAAHVKRIELRFLRRS